MTKSAKYHKRNKCINKKYKMKVLNVNSSLLAQSHMIAMSRKDSNVRDSVKIPSTLTLKFCIFIFGVTSIRDTPVLLPVLVKGKCSYLLQYKNIIYHFIIVY